jgi:hypothetical protein
MTTKRYGAAHVIDALRRDLAVDRPELGSGRSDMRILGGCQPILRSGPRNLKHS